jgi:hydrogenase maturation protease
MNRRTGAADASASAASAASATAPSGGGRDAVAGTPPSIAPGARVVLYGIGNDLRGDDGAGVRVAHALEGRVPWRVRAVHGLTPELADEIKDADVALFVDADADLTLERPTWCRHPLRSCGAAGGSLMGHALDVPGLLRLTSWLFDRTPAAATLSLPARSFDLGETLTAPAEAGVAVAIHALVRLARG